MDSFLAFFDTLNFSVLAGVRFSAASTIYKIAESLFFVITDGGCKHYVRSVRDAAHHAHSQKIVRATRQEFSVLGGSCKYNSLSQ